MAFSSSFCSIRFIPFYSLGAPVPANETCQADLSCHFLFVRTPQALSARLFSRTFSFVSLPASPAHQVPNEASKTNTTGPRIGSSHTVTPPAARRHSNHTPAFPEIEVARGFGPAAYLAKHTIPEHITRDSVPPPMGLFAPTLPTYSDDSEEGGEAEEVERRLSLENLREREAEDQRRALELQQGWAHVTASEAFFQVQLSATKHARRVSDWFAGVQYVSPSVLNAHASPPSTFLSGESSVGSSISSRGQSSAVASLTITNTSTDDADADAVANVLQASVDIKGLDEVKSQTSGAGPSMTREERMRQGILVVAS